MYPKKPSFLPSSPFNHERISLKKIPSIISLKKPLLSYLMDGAKKSSSPTFLSISKATVRPSPASDSGESRRIIHLTPWDLRLLSIDYIKKGLLFPKPADCPIHSMTACLESSLSLALRLFFPLSGRLATTHHHNATSAPSLSISIDCNDEGAELIVAKAETVSAADILACQTSLLASLFPLNGAICHDSHVHPLLSVQLTELADSVFLAFSMNHAIADGTSFWHFINSWSDISRSTSISCPPFLDRWFPENISPPLRLPVADLLLQLRKYDPPPLAEAYFYFSAKTIAEFKAKAKAEVVNTDVQITSLQALLAQLWRSVNRARKLLPEQETAYLLATGSRVRLRPALPATYFGNSVLVVTAKVFVGELAEQGLGWTARRLNEAVARQGDTEIRERFLCWAKKPTSLVHFNEFSRNNMFTGSSPRFEVFGNDFGWGRPIAVRSGPANKVDGTATVFPSRESGGAGIQLCLTEEAMSSLLDDIEFMDTTSSEFEDV